MPATAGNSISTQNGNRKEEEDEEEEEEEEEEDEEDTREGKTSGD